jgi:hypothetical protein
VVQHHCGETALHFVEIVFEADDEGTEAVMDVLAGDVFAPGGAG